MAEGSSVDTVPGKSTSDIEENKSDLNMEINCDPCKDDGNLLPIKGYCVDCDEYLCENCFDYHRVPRPFRKHVLQTKESMPKKKSELSNRSTRKFKCQLHSDCFITHHCKNHDQVFCERCILIGHADCKDVFKVEDIAKDVEKTEEFKTFDKKITESVDGYRANKETAERNMQLAEDCHSRALGAFRKSIGDIKKKDIDKLKSITNTCDLSLNEIERWQTDRIEFQKTLNSGDLFVLMKLTQNQFCLESGRITNLANDNDIEKYDFQCADKESGRIGQLSIFPHLIKKINCKNGNEKKECSIRDMASLGNDLLILTDRSDNDSIKLINTDTNTIFSAYKVKSGPWNMTVTDDKQMFMTQPGSKSLYHLRRPTEDLSDIREIPIGFKGYGIKSENQRLRITSTDPGKVIETDFEGKHIKTIVNDMSIFKDSSGESYVTSPKYLVQNKRNNKMNSYVSCSEKNSVLEMSNDGNVKLVLKSEKLNQPYGIAVEDDNTLLVCSYGAKMVFRVTLHGKFTEIFDKPFEFIPWCLEFDKGKRELYVAGQSDCVYTYQL